MFLLYLCNINEFASTNFFRNCIYKFQIKSSQSIVGRFRFQFQINVHVILFFDILLAKVSFSVVMGMGCRDLTIRRRKSLTIPSCAAEN